MRKGVTLAGVDRDACVLRLSGGVMKEFMLELQEKSVISNLTVTCSDPDSGLQDCWGAIHVKYQDDYADSVALMYPEKTGVFRLGMEQVIYSPALVTNILVKKKKLDFSKHEKHRNVNPDF